MNAGTTIFLIVLFVWRPQQSKCLQCLLTTLTKERGTIYYTPASSPQRLTKECSWELKPPRDEEFLLVARITRLSAYEGDDRIVMFDGNVLNRQVVNDERNEICLKYILDQSFSNNCLTKLAELHCSRGSLRRLIMPIRLTVSTRGRIESDPSQYHYTNFRLSFKYHYCPSEQGRNIIVPEQSVITIENSVGSTSDSTVVLILLVFLFTMCIPLIAFLLYKILSTRKKKQKLQIVKKNAEIEALHAKNEVLKASAAKEKTIIAPPYTVPNPAPVYYAVNGQPSAGFPPFYPQQSQPPGYSNKNPLSFEEDPYRVKFHNDNEIFKSKDMMSSTDQTINESHSYNTLTSRDFQSPTNTSYDRSASSWPSATSRSSINERYGDADSRDRKKSWDRSYFQPNRSASDWTSGTSCSCYDDYFRYDRGRSRERKPRRSRSYPSYDRYGSSRGILSDGSRSFRRREGRSEQSPRNSSFKRRGNRFSGRGKSYSDSEIKYSRSSDRCWCGRKQRRRSRGYRGYNKRERGRSRSRKSKKRSRSRRRSRRKRSKNKSSVSGDSRCCCEKLDKRRSRSKRRRRSSSRRRRSRSSSWYKRKRRTKRTYCPSSLSPHETTGDSSYATAAPMDFCDCFNPIDDEHLCQCAAYFHRRFADAIRGQTEGLESIPTYTTRTRDFPDKASSETKPTIKRPCRSMSEGSISSTNFCCSLPRDESCAISNYNSFCNDINCNNVAALLFWMALCMNCKNRTFNKPNNFKAIKPAQPNQLRKITGPIPKKIACIAKTSPLPCRKTKSFPGSLRSRYYDSDSSRSSICETRAKSFLKPKQCSLDAFRNICAKRRHKRKRRSRSRRRKHIDVVSDELCDKCPVLNALPLRERSRSRRRLTHSESTEGQRALHVTISETFDPTDLEERSKRSRSKKHRSPWSERDKKDYRLQRRENSAYGLERDLTEDDRRYKSRKRPSHSMIKSRRPTYPFDNRSGKDYYRFGLSSDQNLESQPFSKWKRESLRRPSGETLGPDYKFGRGAFEDQRETLTRPRRLQFQNQFSERMPTRSILLNRSEEPSINPEAYQTQNQIPQQQFLPQLKTYPDPLSRSDSAAQQYSSLQSSIPNIGDSSPFPFTSEQLSSIYPQSRQDYSQSTNPDMSATSQTQLSKEYDNTKQSDDADSTRRKSSRRRKKRHGSKKTDESSEDQSRKGDDQTKSELDDTSKRRSLRRKKRRSSHKRKESDDNIEGGGDEKAKKGDKRESTSEKRSRRRSPRSKSKRRLKESDDEKDEKRSRRSRRFKSRRRLEATEGDIKEKSSKNKDDGEESDDEERSSRRTSHRRSRRSKTKNGSKEDKRKSRRSKSKRRLEVTDDEKEEKSNKNIEDGEESDDEKRSSRRMSRRRSRRSKSKDDSKEEKDDKKKSRRSKSKRRSEVTDGDNEEKLIKNEEDGEESDDEKRSSRRRSRRRSRHSKSKDDSKKGKEDKRKLKRSKSKRRLEATDDEKEEKSSKNKDEEEEFDDEKRSSRRRSRRTSAYGKSKDESKAEEEDEERKGSSRRSRRRSRKSDKESSDNTSDKRKSKHRRSHSKRNSD